MTDKEFSLIQARVREEISNIDSLMAELEKRGLIKANRDSGKAPFTEDSFFIRAIGSVLHDFYVMVENVLEIIGREIDESLPQGQDWHIKLLKQMALDVPGVRVAVLSKSTMQALDKYRAFRHVFRNVYGYNLESNRILELVQQLPETVANLKKDLQNFLKDMGTIIN